jgi:hypothetical protein
VHREAFFACISRSFACTGNSFLLSTLEVVRALLCTIFRASLDVVCAHLSRFLRAYLEIVPAQGRNILRASLDIVRVQ